MVPPGVTLRIPTAIPPWFRSRFQPSSPRPYHNRTTRFCALTDDSLQVVKVLMIDNMTFTEVITFKTMGGMVTSRSSVTMSAVCCAVRTKERRRVTKRIRPAML